MNVEPLKIEIAQHINIKAVQNLVAESVKRISVEMVKVLMSGREDKLTVKELAEKHTLKLLDSELSTSNEKTQMVYHKLFSACKEHITNFSSPLLMTISMINNQTDKSDSGDKFLGSFVFPEAKSLVTKLKNEHPAALENTKIWA